VGEDEWAGPIGAAGHAGAVKSSMARVLKKTPAELGYSFPPEWGPHRGTWFSWPRPEGISFPGKYHTVPENLARIMAEIALRERVEIIVANENYEHLVREQLKEHGGPTKNIFFHHIKTNECWCRDHGPAFVVKGKRSAIVDWGFNAWGGKYPPYDDDDAVPSRVADELKVPVFYPGIVMEGGAVDFNGEGVVLTTESCLLNKNRNPGLSRKQIERHLKAYYSQKHVLWLGEGIAGDDTDGHIDDLARFVRPWTIVTAVEDDPRDENYSILRENLYRLKMLKDQLGRPFEIVTIPMPHAVEHEGQRLPATYLNFYFVNGAILVPTYRDRRNDRRALAILQRLLPDRKVIGIDCVELIWGLGAIHCLTQQQPKL
jgi:agmatine deiminase